jgi:hypothetical protein
MANIWRMTPLLCLPIVAAFGFATRVRACDIGVYVGPGGGAVIVTNDAAPEASPDFRYTFLDGRRGHFDAADNLIRCTVNGVEVGQAGAAVSVWPKLSIIETRTHFTSHGTDLSGMLLTPQDDLKTRPLVIVLHGSEKTTAFGTVYPYIFAAQGIATFLYDKRGTGTSGGDYTQNFDLLADDAVAASREARRLADGHYSRWGYFGGSQGGWIAPLAAKIGGADFVAVGFGLVLSPLEEDSEQVFLELRSKGYDEKTIAQAKDVTDATGAVVASHLARGFAELARVKRRYAGMPWLQQIDGEFTGDVLRGTESELRRTGPPLLDGLNIIWHYDAMGVLRRLHTPQLWVLAGSDRDAPSDLTRARLTAMIREGLPIKLYVFPNTDHGITEFTEAADGTRTKTRVADGYYRLLGDWIWERTRPPYGTAEAIAISGN